MSCPTATRWFVLDDEYYSKIPDYTVLRDSEIAVRGDIEVANNDCPEVLPDGSPAPVFFNELYQGRAYDFATQGHMLWADLDESKPEHEAKVQKYRSTHKEQGTESEEYTAFKDVVVNLLYKVADVGIFEVDEHGDDTKKDLKARDRRRESFRRQFHKSLREGHMCAPLLEVILSYYKEPEQKQRVIDYITFQNNEVDKRPVIILVGVVDSMQTPIRGEKKGWAIGYDVLKDLLICKPFFRHKDHHPLAIDWYTDNIVDDRVSASLTPLDFIHSYRTLVENIQSSIDCGSIKTVSQSETNSTETEGRSAPETQLVLPNATLGFEMVVFAHTARFVLTHWAGFVGSRPDMKDGNFELHENFVKAHDNIEQYLAKIQVLVGAK